MERVNNRLATNAERDGTSTVGNLSLVPGLTVADTGCQRNEGLTAMFHKSARRSLLVAFVLTAISALPALADGITRIAFVDTGNTGRSVTAEALANATIAERHLPILVISRAVDLNPYNMVPEVNAAILLAQRGLDVSGHRAVQVTANDVRHSDLVLVMTEKHKATVLDQFPDAKGKIFTLSEYSTGTSKDVVDAYNQPMAVYEETFKQIDGYMTTALEKAVKK